MHEVLAERIKAHRKRRGWSQQTLADEMTALGYPIDRVTLAKIEAGKTRAENASLREVLIIGAALDVPPLALFLPLGENTCVSITPNARLDPLLAFRWITGETPFPVEEDGLFVAKNPAAWYEGSEVVRMFLMLYRLEDEASRAWPEPDPTPAKQERFDLALLAVFQHRTYMRAAGQDPLWIPREWVNRAAELGLDTTVEEKKA